MNAFLDASQYSNAIGIANIAQQFGEAKQALEQQKKEALMPISELALGGASTAGIEQIGSAIKTAVIAKGKELIGSKLKDLGFDEETVNKVMSGNFKGTLEDAVSKAKGLAEDKLAELKDAATSKLEDLKQQGMDAVEQAKGDLQDKLNSIKDMHENGIEEDGDFFPPGTDLNPIGSGGTIDLSPQTEAIEEPAIDSFTGTSSISQSGNIAETSFGKTPPEDFAGLSEVSDSGVGVPEAFSNIVGDVSNTISGVSEGISGAVGEAGSAVSGAVSSAIAGGTEAASGLAEGIGLSLTEGLSAVADVALGPVGVVAGIIGGLVGLFESDKPAKILAPVLNPSVQFGS